mgnify:CR=1 FL=1
MPNRPVPTGPDSSLPATATHDEFRYSLTCWLSDNLTPEVVAAGRAGLLNAKTIEILRSWNRICD